ncbi:MAG: hypothetical protein LBQ24_07060 [Candidatus Peribacteria bacterium]|jgi:hypothetical protein|nr:hypothetical protein [Candidatus Peribacteria bacterium]
MVKTQLLKNKSISSSSIQATGASKTISYFVSKISIAICHISSISSFSHN